MSVGAQLTSTLLPFHLVLALSVHRCCSPFRVSLTSTVKSLWKCLLGDFKSQRRGTTVSSILLLSLQHRECLGEFYDHHVGRKLITVEQESPRLKETDSEAKYLNQQYVQIRIFLNYIISV